jgi:hypothetical protein
MAPDGNFYTAVWGKITTVKGETKVGFKNDYVILNPAYIISKSLCRVRPVPRELVNSLIYAEEEDEDELEFKTKNLYVCIENKASDSDTVTKLNKSKVRKRNK